MKKLLIALILILVTMIFILMMAILFSQPKEVNNQSLPEIINDKKYVEIAEAAVEDIEEEYYEDYYPQYTYYNYHDSDYDDMSAKDYIAQRESGQDYEAVNGQYYGKYQLQIDMLGGDLSPENQEATAQRYMEERYGTWENAQEFWDEHGWW